MMRVSFIITPVFFALMIISGSNAFNILSPSSALAARARTSTSTSTSTSTTQLYNVPPPSINDVQAFKEYANKQSPPASFFELQQDCIQATKLALRDGYKLLEIEFPPLPANVLEMDDVSAYEISNANLNLALDYAKGLISSNSAAPTTTATTTTSTVGTTANNNDNDNNNNNNNNNKNEKQIMKNIKNIAILFPDEAETDIFVEKQLGGSKNPYPGIQVASLRQSEEGDDRAFKPEQIFLSLLGNGSGGSVRAIDNVDMYICIVASAQELPDIEELSKLDPDTPIVFYNMKLDVLRGDLGAPAFPPKEFQDRFLSRVKPVYFLRTRQYSRSTAKPPFLVNFQGCLFRSYPGQFQTLLDTGNGRYRRVKGNDQRPPLGLFKEQLVQDLKDQGVVEEESKTLAFLRTGYKTTTWWEEDREDASDDWCT